MASAQYQTKKREGEKKKTCESVIITNTFAVRLGIFE